jgi:hypothetical protein
MTASNHCPLESSPRRCETGVPADPAVAVELQRLAGAGVKLGAALSVWTDRQGRRRSAREVIEHACRIRVEDTTGLFEYLFLDFSPKRSSAALQRMVTRMRGGASCPAGGWEEVMTNTFDPEFGGEARPPRGTAMHAKSLAILRGADWRIRSIRAARGQASALAREDLRFIDWVRRHRPSAVPVLKIGVPELLLHRFALLSRRVQGALLRRWAGAAARLGFTLTYPLFVSAPNRTGPYDSRIFDTYELQRELLQQPP